MNKNDSRFRKTTFSLFVLTSLLSPSLLANPSNKIVEKKKVEAERESSQVGPAIPATAAADNTIQNRKVENRETLTAEEQSNSKTDLELTQKLRESLVQDKQLSMDAKNIKIITINGIITLKGNVETVKEMEKIEQTARNLKGAKKVNNELLVEDKT